MRSYNFIKLVTWPSGKAKVCKTFIPRFKSGRHLQKEKVRLSACFFFLEVRLSAKAGSPAGGNGTRRGLFAPPHTPPAALSRRFLSSFFDSLKNISRTILRSGFSFITVHASRFTPSSCLPGILGGKSVIVKREEGGVPQAARIIYEAFFSLQPPFSRVSLL